MCALHPIKINQQLESIFMPAVVKILQECKVYDSKLTKYMNYFDYSRSVCGGNFSSGGWRPYFQ